MIRKLKNIIRKFVFLFLKPEIIQKTIFNSYSQAGEDKILDFLFSSKKITLPSYLDIGVFYPTSISNTHLFYTRGSRGVCVEADPTLIPIIKKARSEDKVINVGVGVNNSSGAEFYVFNDKGLSTFDKKEAEYREGFGTFKIEKVCTIPMQPINSILKENFDTYPDFLSIDIEGLDLEVLKTLDFNTFKIPVICVETCVYSENHIKPKDNRIVDFIITKGYFVYADTYINTIFVNKKWFEKI